MQLPDFQNIESRLRQIDEEAASAPNRVGPWSRKHLLGHLIDSAANNHIRFVRAALQSEYHGPSYDGDAWVRLHRYDQLPWTQLVDWWSTLNQIIVQVVREIPAGKYAVPCYVEGFEMMTLQALIEDYAAHMQHHLDQILWST